MEHDQIEERFTKIEKRLTDIEQAFIGFTELFREFSIRSFALEGMIFFFLLKTFRTKSPKYIEDYKNELSDLITTKYLIVFSESMKDDPNQKALIKDIISHLNAFVDRIDAESKDR